jgi:hypothetical protein
MGKTGVLSERATAVNVTVMRRSISCMLAGLTIAVPIVVLTAPWAWDWSAPRVFWALVSIAIAGVMVLYDELGEVT